MNEAHNTPVWRQWSIPQLMLAWYLAFFCAMAIAPLDQKVWWSINVLPLAFVIALIATYRTFPLSTVSYMVITVWLTLHTIAAHYTYPKVPAGFWLDRLFDFHRNHFDRIVHFSFGLLMTVPLVDIFRRRCQAKGWLLPYMVVMTILGFSGFWEIMEAWAGQLTHPDLERALVGHQGDVWDPQRDMAAALYGSLLCTVFLALTRRLHEEPEITLESMEDTLALEPAGMGATSGLSD